LEKYFYVMNILTILTIVFIFIGIFSSVYAVTILHKGDITSDFFSLFFWLATLFFGVQSLSFMLAYRRSKYHYKDTVSNSFIKSYREKIAILVPIYNESPDMAITNLMAIYSNVRDNAELYILDDSTDNSSEAIKDISNKINAHYIHRTDRTGYKAGALNNALKIIPEEYVTVIDIDQMPSPDFVRETVELLDNNPDIAFVQVPQYYVNTDSGTLAGMAEAQQFIFYEILTEGKSVLGSMFSCGTNVIYRKSALKSIGYFDESNIVEDIATSVNLVSKGYKGLYYNKKLVFGRAPVTMEGYINQQWRWSAGSLKLMPKIFKDIIFKRKYSIRTKIDWLATSTWYLFGWFYLIFLLAPLLDVLHIRVLVMNPYIYILAWMPYTAILMFTFIMTHMDKKAPIKYVFYNMAANLILFPLSISVTLSVIMKKKKPFTTARTGGKLPWYRFWPQMTLLVLVMIASSLLVYHGGFYNYVTAFWGYFQCMLLFPLFMLNKPPKESSIDYTVFTS
jgi:cellulose synthase (UDP-forming)